MAEKRMSQLGDVIVADRLLSRCGGCTIADIASAINKSPRTARRIVEFIAVHFARQPDLYVEVVRHGVDVRHRYRTPGMSVFSHAARRSLS